MDPALTASLIQMAPALIQGGIGLAQTIGGVSGIAAKRPTYNVPSYVAEALEKARMAADTEMPGYTQAIQANQLLQANMTQAAMQSANMNAALAIVQAQGQKANADLMARNAEYQRQQLSQLLAQLANSANYADQEFQINEFAPYADKRRLGEDMLGAGVKNISNATSTAADMYSLLQLANMLNSKQAQNGLTTTDNAVRIGERGNSSILDTTPKSEPMTIEQETIDAIMQMLQNKRF